MHGDPDDLLQRIEDDVKRAQARAEAMSGMQGAVSAVSVECSAGGVTVRLDGSGEVVGLSIDDSALTRGGTRLSADVLRLLKQARAQLQVRMAEVANEYLGQGDPLVGQLEAQAAQAMEDAGDDPDHGLQWR